MRARNPSCSSAFARPQWATGEMPAQEAPERSGGPRLLGIEELREQRRLLVRRLAEAHRTLDGEDEPPPAPAERPATAPETAAGRRPRRAPAVRPQPT